MLKVYDKDGVLHTPEYRHNNKKEKKEKAVILREEDRYREVSYEQWQDFLISAPEPQLVFYRTYLETLNVNDAVNAAYEGKLTAPSARGRRRWALLNKVWPYIMFYFRNYGCKITKEWLEAKWLSFTDERDILAQNALKELGKLCSFYDTPTTNVQINNDGSATSPVQINFSPRFDDDNYDE